MELYLDSNAFLGELSVVKGDMQVYTALTDELDDLVDETGANMQYQEINSAADLGGFGVLAEIVVDAAFLEFPTEAFSNWIVDENTGLAQLNFAITNEPVDIVGQNAGILAEIIIND